MALRGYDRYEYENLDEYEDDGLEQEEEAGEGEYEEETCHQPTQEELEYLELRQRLKENLRKRMKMKRELGSGCSNSRENSKLPFNDNYGSFFGPSQPVIAQRVIQESKSLLENPRAAERLLNSHHHNNNKSSAKTSAASKARPGGQPPSNLANKQKTKTKAQMIKNTRDYSFLLSENAVLPVPAKDLQSQNVAVRNSEARSTQVTSRSKQLSSSTTARASNGREERKPMPTGGKIQSKMVTQKLPTGGRPNAMDSRKQVGSGHGSGPGRPMVSKGSSSKNPIAHTVEKKLSGPVAKNSVSSLPKPNPAKLQPPITKKSLQQKEHHQGLTNGKTVSKASSLSSKYQHQVKQSAAKVPPHTVKNLPKKRPSRPYDDEDDGEAAISMIRQMFGYNPNRYRDEDDDSDMEANFDEILMEERKSAKYARKEDEEEFIKIQEEERRERMRKEAKRRKFNQR